MSEPSAQALEQGQESRRLARLRWRCRRGLLELDLVLAQFLDQHYARLNAAERRAFERLLATSDVQLLAYLNGTAVPHDRELHELVEKLRGKPDR